MLGSLPADVLLHVLCFAIKQGKGSSRSTEAVLCTNKALAELPSRTCGDFWFDLCKARDWIRVDRLWTLRVIEVDSDAFWHHQFKKWRCLAFKRNPHHDDPALSLELYAGMFPEVPNDKGPLSSWDVADLCTGPTAYTDAGLADLKAEINGLLAKAQRQRGITTAFDAMLECLRGP